MDFLDRIRQTASRYDMLYPGDHVGVAVSGGADSVCLLHVLLEFRSEFALHLAVIHVDHGLRGAESLEDAQFVHNYAQRLGLPFHLRTLDLDRRGNLEQEARSARYAFFRDLIQDGAVQKIATGHTRSDQAETVLYRFLRGAGTAGLAGIRPITDSGMLRPLLDVTRSEIETWLKERAIQWRQDATNADLRFDRNRIRHRLLPTLEAEWNPGLSENLAQTADWASEEEQYWQSLIGQLATDWVRSAKSEAVLDATRRLTREIVRIPTEPRPSGSGNANLVLDATPLDSLPVAVARRLIREIVQQVKGDLLGVSFAHIESIRELAAGPRGEGRCQIAGLEVVRSFNWLRFAKNCAEAAGPPPTWQFCVTAPGRYPLPLEYVVPPTTIELELVRNNGVYNGSLNALDGERVCGPLILRNWRAGDRYRRDGHAGFEKLKKLFEEYRVPLWERQNWPIMTVGNRIGWARQFGPAAEFAVNADSRTVLQIHETHETSEKV